MKKLNAFETKQIELQILVEFDRFCKENNLTYYMAYGTLIGAVRHKGFIPWDDDIDINMTRKDYNLFIEKYNQLNKDGRYKVISPQDADSKHSFVKFIDTHTVKIESGTVKRNTLGIDIDVFPLDGQPDDPKEFDDWYNKLIKLYNCYNYIVYSNLSIKRKLIAPFLRLIYGSPSTILKKAANLHAMYPYESSKYVGAIESSFNSKGNRFEKTWFEKTIDLEFEDLIFSAPICYDKILTCVYGDYMKLPPKEQQITHHSNVTYLIEGNDTNEKI